MRPHTVDEAVAFVVDIVEAWQEVVPAAVGRRLVHSQPTSTTCWPAARSRPPRRMRALR